MNIITSWKDCLRDDLNNIPFAIEKGWTPKFHYNDKMYNRISFENIPHNAVSFEKNNKITWKCYNNTRESITSYWRVADLIDNHYCNHRDYNNIEDVFENE